MTTPLFTVGIPTYNRAHLLPYTLACLLQQTYRDFEIVISDNASSDNTADVVRAFNDPRVRYFRQSATVGPAENFMNCAQLARSEWFMIQQDDDVTSPYFLERCAHAIQKTPELVMYAAEIMHSQDVERLSGAVIGSFPLKHHWDQPQPRLIPGAQIAALTWFLTGFMPPAQVMPTRLFRKHCPLGDKAEYLGDRYLTSRVACEGIVAFDSYVGAILRDHPNRMCRTIPDAVRTAQRMNAEALTALFAANGVDWRSALRAILPEFPLDFRERLLGEHLHNEYVHPDALGLLIASIAEERGITPELLLSDLKASRLHNARGGRLDRLGLPRPVVRALRHVFSALGKRY